MGDVASYPPLTEVLGYEKDARLLILNADDAGMCHAVNEAVGDLFAAGMVRSCSAIVPAPWFMEFVRLRQRREDLRCGVHLTVTSEWAGYRWGPVAPRDQVPSLLDEEGYFHRDEHDFFDHATVEDVAREFRAQIERAVAFGLAPTHIDSHMGAYHWDERFFEVARDLADEFGLTMRIGYPPRRDTLRGAGWLVPDHLVWETYEVPLEAREEFMRETIRRLAPGVTEVLIHPGRAGEELSAICGEEAARRAFDLKFFSDPETRRTLDDEGVVCIGYDILQQRQNETRKR